MITTGRRISVRMSVMSVTVLSIDAEAYRRQRAQARKVRAGACHQIPAIAYNFVLDLFLRLA